MDEFLSATYRYTTSRNPTRIFIRVKRTKTKYIHDPVKIACFDRRRPYFATRVLALAVLTFVLILNAQRKRERERERESARVCVCV